MRVSFLEEHFNTKLEISMDFFSEVSTDSRALKENCLFIALSGENFDGNKFVLDALSKGAAAALTSDKKLSDNPNCIYVEDTLSAMQSLGRAWQNHVNPKVLAITGSNGKTTAKFFTYQLLRNYVKASFSPKSYNNEIGVPFTQVNLKENDEVLISEIGTNNKGEIKTLTKMVSPHASVVTTVGSSHLEGFGSVENVALEKSDIYKYSDRAESFIFNLDNEYTLEMMNSFKSLNSNSISISISTQDSKADIFLQAEQLDVSNLKINGHIYGDKIDTAIAVFGEHHIYNLMVALAFGKFLEIPTQDLINQFKELQTPWGRCQIFETKEKGTVLFDAYNANLQSMKALLSSVKTANIKGSQIIVGEMFELGDKSKEMHFELGRLIGLMDFEVVCFIGQNSGSFNNGLSSAEFSKNLIISDTYDEELAIKLKNVLNPSSTILIKGSRGVGLEKLLPLWLEEIPKM